MLSVGMENLKHAGVAQNRLISPSSKDLVLLISFTQKSVGLYECKHPPWSSKSTQTQLDTIQSPATWHRVSLSERKGPVI